METPEAGQNILTRGLPKTRQFQSYAADDDGIFEAGWWRGRLNANNRTRFIAQTIGGDYIVLDRATGLMWCGDGNDAGGGLGLGYTWANAITYCSGLNYAGFTDWRLPNRNELGSILHIDRPSPLIDVTFFTNIHNGYYWTSSTYPMITANAYFWTMTSSVCSHAAKTNTYYLLAVRKGL